MADRPNLNPLLTWLWDLLSFYSVDEIVVTSDYHKQVMDVQDVLRSDVSGCVNSILDFAINAASVPFTVESENEAFAELIEEWFDRINESLIGKIPTGLQALSKEYFRERWKNSSLIVMRTIWEDIDIGGTTFNLPTKMWVVDGGNIIVLDDSETRIIGNEKYYIKIDDKKKKLIPAQKNELIFVQKPYSPWSSIYPTPFLFQRGLWKNLKFYELINKKAERFVGKALEYMLAMKKGTEQLALQGNAAFTYDENDLKKAKDDLKDVLERNKTEAGTPVYATNFDTMFEHIVPEYSKVLNKELFAPIEKRLLAGLGLVEIVEGIASTRREAILNPRPFISDIENGINDYITLLKDILTVIAERNKAKHPKYFGNDIDLHYAPVKDFISDSLRDHLRSMYDRGVLSKQTYSEVVGEIDFDIEVVRRGNETKDNLDKKMYPPVVDNREGVGIDLDGEDPKLKIIAPQPKLPPRTSPANPKVPVSKQGPEKKNFKGSEE